jgi:hypothetical protein
MKRLLLAAVVGFACLSPIAANPVKPDPKWATVRGQVIWAEDEIPPVKKRPTRGIPGLPAALDDDSLLIDAKSKGVKNVMVWLLPEKAGGAMPVHPALAAAKPAPVTITNAGGMYSPRIVVMQKTQLLMFVNDLPAPDAVRLCGRTDNRQYFLKPDEHINPKLVPEKFPLLFDSPIHPWMAGRVGVFDHPYFALTDKAGVFEIPQAPVGKFRICVLHETAGWLHRKTGNKLGDGQAIEIKPGVTDLGVFRMRNE